MEISEPDVDKMVKEAAGQLSSKCGAVVEEVSIPMHSDGDRNFILFYFILFIYLFILVIFCKVLAQKLAVFLAKIGCVATWIISVVAKKRFKRVQVSSVHSGSANSLGNEAVEPRLLGGDHG